MGWSFTQHSRDKLISTLVKPILNDDAVQETIAQALRGNVLWTLVRITAKRPGVCDLAPGETTLLIVCHLLECSSTGWGYKTMEESMHPYDYSCPLPFLDKVPTQSAVWREGVRAYHARRRTPQPVEPVATH